MKKLLFTALFFTLLCSNLLALTDICDIQIGPDSKVANFANGQDVTVSMGFSTDEAAGVRIYARPFTNGSLSPGYAASGSGLYMGSGTANSSFTINSGAVLVDEVRIEVYASDNSTLLRRLWVPVRFRFGNVGVNNFSFIQDAGLSSFLLGENFNCKFHYNISYPGGVRIFLRPFTNGVLTPGYSASGSGIYTGTGTNGASSFTINSGKNVHVDAIRVKIVNADQSQDIDEFFLPVNLYFSTVKVTDIVPQVGNFPLFNENRQMTFNYATTESGGVRIFPRPWTNGALTPNYAASGSPLYNGSGNASSTFTISSTNQRVDHVRFNVVNANQTETLLEMWMPVEYTFGNFLVENIQLCPAAPARLELGERVNIHWAYYNDEGQETRVFVRPFSNGALSPGYGASGSGLLPVGTGSISSFFTINSGDVEVDQLRFQVTNADQSAILAEYFVPVSYIFGNPTSAASEQSAMISELTLSPNPAIDQARLSITLKEAGKVNVKLLDLAGRLVFSIKDRTLNAEVAETIELNLATLANGTYLVQMEGENFSATRKLVLLR